MRFVALIVLQIDDGSVTLPTRTLHSLETHRSNTTRLRSSPYSSLSSEESECLCSVDTNIAARSSSIAPPRNGSRSLPGSRSHRFVVESAGRARSSTAGGRSYAGHRDMDTIAPVAWIRFKIEKQRARTQEPSIGSCELSAPCSHREHPGRCRPVPPPPPARCDGCAYFRDGYELTGTCHRYPPAFAGDQSPREDHHWRFPCVMSKAWCGEFAPRRVPEPR